MIINNLIDHLGEAAWLRKSKLKWTLIQQSHQILSVVSQLSVTLKKRKQQNEQLNPKHMLTRWCCNEKGNHFIYSEILNKSNLLMSLFSFSNFLWSAHCRYFPISVYFERWWGANNSYNRLNRNFHWQPKNAHKLLVVICPLFFLA